MAEFTTTIAPCICYTSVIMKQKQHTNKQNSIMLYYNTSQTLTRATT